MFKGWPQKKVGNCLTEYKHPRFDKLVKEFDTFYRTSQFMDDLHGSKTSPRLLFDHLVPEPRCGEGDVLYGVTKNSRLIRLMAIIDSSD